MVEEGIILNITLNNGIEMPQIGFGVWQVEDGEEVINSVKKAIEVGYRLIDTAAVYKNEEGVGEAIRQARIPREELFITTKVWNADQGYEATLKAFDTSMEKLGLEYLDLYLIHWPMPDNDNYVDTYKAMEKLYNDGKIRAIGVCNFHIPHIKRLLNECTIKPTVNQIECHPFLSQTEIREFCSEHNIYVEAWSPLMQGGEVLKNEVVLNIAKKYDKTPAQLVIRWHLQNNVIVIPKSVTPNRIESNFDVFDFELSNEDMDKIYQLNSNTRKGPNPEEFHKE